MYLNEIPPIDEVLQNLLQQISDKSTSPDLRDRGYIYWRLLFQSPEKASEVVFNDIPPIQIEEDEDDQELLIKLIRNGGSVSSHLGAMLSSTFTKTVSAINRGEIELDSEYITNAADEKPAVAKENLATDFDDFGDDDILGGTEMTTKQTAGGADDFDLLGIESPSPTRPVNVEVASSNGLDLFSTNIVTNRNQVEEEDLFGDDMSSFAPRPTFFNMPEEVLLKTGTPGKNGLTGIMIRGGFKKSDKTSDSLILSF